jgi:hypothetical protein
MPAKVFAFEIFLAKNCLFKALRWGKARVHTCPVSAKLKKGETLGFPEVRSCVVMCQALLDIHQHKLLISSNKQPLIDTIPFDISMVIR